MLVPLAYIDLDEYIKSLQDALNDKENRRDQMMAKENKNDKQLRKIAELDKQIEHDKKRTLTSKRITSDRWPNLEFGIRNFLCKFIWSELLLWRFIWKI